MPFIDGDRARIVDALQLVTTQDEPISVLANLMDDVTQRDANNSTNRADQIRILLSQIEGVQGTIDATDTASITAGQVGPQVAINIAGQGSVEYAESSMSGVLSANAERLKRVRSLRQKIHRLLDPYKYLNRYKGVGRAVNG